MVHPTSTFASGRLFYFAIKLVNFVYILISVLVCQRFKRSYAGDTLNSIVGFNFISYCLVLISIFIAMVYVGTHRTSQVLNFVFARSQTGLPAEFKHISKRRKRK